jgi:hypothetical protein
MIGNATAEKEKDVSQFRTTQMTNQGRTAICPTRSLIAAGVSPSEIAMRLQRVPDSTLMRPAIAGRFKVDRNRESIYLSADIAILNSELIIGCQATSRHDVRRNLIKKAMFVVCWLSLLGAFLTYTGASQSLAQEWSRRQGGSNLPLVAEMAKTGRRLSPEGFAKTQKSMRPIDLLSADPALLGAMFASIAIIGAISATITRAMPEQVVENLASLMGVPTMKQLHASGREFQEEIASILKKGR